MDAAATVAVVCVAVALVVGAAIGRHRAGGLRFEVRLWWGTRTDRDPAPGDGPPPGDPGPL